MANMSTFLPYLYLCGKGSAYEIQEVSTHTGQNQSRETGLVSCICAQDNALSCRVGEKKCIVLVWAEFSGQPRGGGPGSLVLGGEGGFACWHGL